MTDTFLRSQADAILSSAISSPDGIVVRTTDSLRAKQVLYRFRKELQNPEYLNLQIRFSPDAPKTELWLIKRQAEGVEEVEELQEPSESQHSPSNSSFLLDLE